YPLPYPPRVVSTILSNRLRIESDMKGLAINTEYFDSGLPPLPNQLPPHLRLNDGLPNQTPAFHPGKHGRHEVDHPGPQRPVVHVQALRPHQVFRDPWRRQRLASIPQRHKAETRTLPGPEVDAAPDRSNRRDMVRVRVRVEQP